MTRVRYFSVPGTHNYVTKPIVAGNKSVVITIMADTNSLVVVEEHTKSVLHQETGNSFRDLKNRSKQLLKNLGTVFSDEVRRKRTSTLILDVETAKVESAA